MANSIAEMAARYSPESCYGGTILATLRILNNLPDPIAVIMDDTSRESEQPINKVCSFCSLPSPANNCSCISKSFCRKPTAPSSSFFIPVTKQSSSLQIPTQLTTGYWFDFFTVIYFKNSNFILEMFGRNIEVTCDLSLNYNHNGINRLFLRINMKAKISKTKS